MKRIWFVSHYSMPPEYEMRNKTQMYAHYLNKMGYETKIFAASTIHNTKINLISDNSEFICRKYDDLNFIHIRCRNYTGNGIKRILNMLEFSTRFKSVAKNFLLPDIVIADVNCINYGSIFAFCKQRNIKFFIDIRDLWPLSIVEYLGYSENNPLMKYLYYREKMMYKRADRIIFSIEGGNDYIKDKGWDKGHGGPVDLNKVYHINNGVDLEVFNYNKEKYIIEDIALDDKNTFKVVYTGSMRRANNVQVFVGIARIIQDKGCDKVRIIVYGDGDRRAYLENLAKEKNINNIVFKGKVDKKYIPGILSKSDLNIFTGHNSDLFKYGLSLNKMFDYMASGKPTISDVKCGYDNLEKYKCGITVKSDDPNSMSEGIIAFYNMDKNEYDRYCINALKAAQEFDFKNLTKKLEKIILKQ